MSIQFNQPMDPVSEFHRFIKPADVDGHLLLILSVDKKDMVYDQYKGVEVEAVSFTVVDLTAGGDERKVRMQQVGIVSRLQVGQENVLVRVGKVTTKKGFSAWSLLPHKPEDVKQAIAWIENRKVIETVPEPEQQTGWGTPSDEVAPW